jgi:hypothetical protein
MTGLIQGADRFAWMWPSLSRALKVEISGKAGFFGKGTTGAFSKYRKGLG